MAEGDKNKMMKQIADAVDIGKTIHPPPTLGESIGMVAHGRGTDLPPGKK